MVRNHHASPPKVLIGAVGNNWPIKRGNSLIGYLGRGEGWCCSEPTQIPTRNARGMHGEFTQGEGRLGNYVGSMHDMGPIKGGLRVAYW